MRKLLFILVSLFALGNLFASTDDTTKYECYLSGTEVQFHLMVRELENGSESAYTQRPGARKWDFAGTPSIRYIDEQEGLNFYIISLSESQEFDRIYTCYAI